MAVDAATLAAQLSLPETEGTRLLPIARDLVTAYLRGSTTCPEHVKDEAIIRTAGHLSVRRSGHENAIKAGSVDFRLASSGVSAVRQSGAAALLSPWVKRSA